MASFEINKHILKEGQIVIYQRSDHPNPRWQGRISVPSAKGFKRISLKTRDLEEAKRRVYRAWEDLDAKIRSGGTVNSKTYKAVALEYLKSLEFRANTKGKVRTKAKTIRDRLVPYSATYFSTARIDEIGKKELAAYAEWRLNNGLKKVPCANTLRTERSAMMGVFKWALEKGYISSLPDIAQPKGKDNRRPDFTKSEIDFLFAAMEPFAATVKNGRTQRDRAMLCNYVRFMTFSGLRVGEARELRWHDVEERKIDGNNHLVLRVSGKTGKREMFPQGLACAVLMEMRIKRTAECDGVLNLDEHVFYNREGGPVTSFKNGFQSLVEFAELDEAKTGKRRVIYSLRHSYATQMMARSTDLFYLAKNMGTSVEMLERFYGHVAGEDLANAMSKSDFGRVDTMEPKARTKVKRTKVPAPRSAEETKLRLVSSR